MRYSRRICRLTAVSALATCFLATGTLYAQDYTRIPATYGPVSGQASSGSGITPTPSYNSVSSLPGAGVAPTLTTQPTTTYVPGQNGSAYVPTSNNSTARLQSAPAPVVPESPSLAPSVPDEIPIIDSSAPAAPVTVAPVTAATPTTQSPAPTEPAPVQPAPVEPAPQATVPASNALGNTSSYGNTAGYGNTSGYSSVGNYPNGDYLVTMGGSSQASRGWTSTGGTTMDYPSIGSFMNRESGPGDPSEAGFVYTGSPRDGRFWGGADALFWFITGNGNKVPALLTRQNIPTASQVAAGTEIPATVGTLANSETILGGGDFNDDLRYGFKLNVGMWLTPYQNIGIQADWFSLSDDKDEFSFFETYQSGNAAYARPFLDSNTGAESRVIVAYPYSDAVRATTGQNNFVYRIGDPRIDQYSPNGDPIGKGGVNLESRSYVDGGSAALRLRLNRDADPCQKNTFDLIGGYQCLRYNSSLNMWQDTNHTRLSVDRFEAHNTFNGGLLGLVAESKQQSWTLTGGLKLGFGAMNRRMRIDGNTYTWSTSGESPAWAQALYGDTYTGWVDWDMVADAADMSTAVSDVLTANGTSADEIRGGVLATTPNIGYYDEKKFVLIPMVDLGIGYRWNRHFSTNVGYELIYMGDIWTATGAVPDTIDGRNIPQGTANASTVPSFSGDTKELWIQGLKAGLQVEF